ncbi:unnamed protein product [Rotaria sordida]|uniref:Uncharacterized protein n=1 Tax=Rotaria sordida TaxID=392033 RepID=A0A814VT44_9BILA|nr:unnamed protein product [Rotaria sordida]CAF1547900.1 unnamed protein product [Rotaria sordida]
MAIIESNDPNVIHIISKTDQTDISSFIQKLDKIYTIEHINVIKDQENLVHILKFKDDKDANEVKQMINMSEEKKDLFAESKSFTSI